MTSSEGAADATAIIVAAGRGDRFGDPAKILVDVGGRPMLTWSLEAAAAARCVREIIVVTGVHTEAPIRAMVGSMTLHLPVVIVRGGARRQDSVAAGVGAVAPTSSIVLIHDAARPLVTASLFDSCAQVARESGAAIVATAISDTLKRVAHDTIVETIPRDGVWAAQTPQGFQFCTIKDAIVRAGQAGIEFTDEASLLEFLGEPVRVVRGTRANVKVTHPEDIEVVDALLRRRLRRDREEQS